MGPERRSVAWKYFIKKDNDVVICKICKKELKFNSSTTNMLSHLKNKKHRINRTDDDEDVVLGDNRVRGTLSESVNTNVEKETLSYQKLVVPVKMRSIYWKCYGFPASESGAILTKKKVVCLLCKRSITYNGSTTYLKLHLKSKHSEEMAQLENMTPQQIKELVIMKKKGDNIVSSPSIVSTPNEIVLSVSNDDNFDERMQLDSCDIDQSGPSRILSDGTSHDKTELVVTEHEQTCTIDSLHPFMIPIDNKSVSDAVIEFIIMDMQMPDIVEGRGFQRLIATLKSPCEIPSKSKLVEEVIPRLYDSYKEPVQEVLQNIKTHMSLAVEEWQSSNGDSYVTFSVNYHQDKDDHLINKVLSTVKCNSSSENSYWDLVFDNLLEDWKLKLENIKVVVCATNQQELLFTFTCKGLIVVPCMFYSIQEVCTRVCLEEDNVCELLAKCRTLIYVIYKSNNALAALRIQDHLMSLEIPMVSDTHNVWMSTYNMLETVLARRQVINTILENVDPLVYDKEMVNFSDQDWSLIEDLIAVLEPFKVTIMTLSEERSPLVSLMKPLLGQLLNNHLKNKEDDSDNVKIFKTALKTLLSEKYNDPAVNRFLDIATMLDPRFKTLPSMSEEAKVCLDGPIKEKLIEIIEQSPKEVRPVIENSPEKRKSKLLGMVMMLGDLCPATPSATTMTTEDRANLELVQYQSEATAPLDQCPLAWWTQVVPKCPHLALLAGQYTCIPAAAIPSSRIALDAQLNYIVKRAYLSPEVIDRLTFLNANYNLE